MRRFICYLVIGLAILLVIVVTSVMLLTGNKSTPVAGPTAAPSMMPSMAPSLAPTSGRFTNALQVLASVSGAALQDRTSPQYMAADWVTNQDPLQLSVTDAQFLRRYILAVFYFALDGDKWTSCSRNDRSCSGDSTNDSWLSDASECNWLGLTCDGNNQIKSIFFQSATGNGLAGSLPTEISQFSNLNMIILHNNTIRGTLPDFFGAFTQLSTIVLNGNEFYGTVPKSWLQNLKLLGTLQLSSNKITGTIPTLLVNLPLIDVRIDSNDINGTIPEEFMQITSLVNLDLSLNKLVGTLPPSLLALPNLQDFRASQNFKLGGTIPSELTSSLAKLRLGSTLIGGTIPETLYDLPKLNELSIPLTRFHGTLSERLANLSDSLQTLILANNSFTGSVPTAIDALTKLNTLSLQGNEFTGSISQTTCKRYGTSFYALHSLQVDCKEVKCSCCGCTQASTRSK